MTWTQIAVLAIAGPLGFLQLLSAIAYLRFEHCRFELFRAFVLVVCALAIYVAFAGVQP